jgi:hypothetical protein
MTAKKGGGGTVGGPSSQKRQGGASGDAARQCRPTCSCCPDVQPLTHPFGFLELFVRNSD